LIKKQILLSKGICDGDIEHDDENKNKSEANKFVTGSPLNSETETFNSPGLYFFFKIFYFLSTTLVKGKLKKDVEIDDQASEEKNTIKDNENENFKSPIREDTMDFSTGKKQSNYSKQSTIDDKGNF
jgi:hypothetical protein